MDYGFLTSSPPDCAFEAPVTRIRFQIVAFSSNWKRNQTVPFSFCLHGYAFSFDPAGEFYHASISCCESERGLLVKVTREIHFSILNLKICASVSRDRPDLLIFVVAVASFSKSSVFILFTRIQNGCVFKSIHFGLRFRGPFSSFSCK